MITDVVASSCSGPSLKAGQSPSFSEGSASRELEGYQGAYESMQSEFDRVPALQMSACDFATSAA